MEVDRAEIIDPGEDRARARRLGVRPTAPEERPRFVPIGPEMVPGRRFLSPVEAMAAVAEV